MWFSGYQPQHDPLTPLPLCKGPHCQKSAERWEKYCDLHNPDADIPVEWLNSDQLSASTE
jgi:hypothetical protein